VSSALNKAGSTSAWRRIRAAVLSEEPMCRWCTTRAATEVDHIISRERGGGDQRDNLAGSCKPCNLARGKGPTHVERKPW
jgi:5-methylcytosine-specific restriction protein A